MAVVTCLLLAADRPRRVASSPPPPDRAGAAASVRVTIPLGGYQLHPPWFFLWQVQKRAAGVCLFLVGFLHQNIVPLVWSLPLKGQGETVKRRRRILHKKSIIICALSASPTCFASQQKASVLYLRVYPVLMACRLWLATSGNGTCLKSSEIHSWLMWWCSLRRLR